LFIGATFAAMENHRTDSIPNDSYPVKSDRLLAACFENKRGLACELCDFNHWSHMSGNTHWNITGRGSSEVASD
jgi:hypothetical protein